MSNDYFQFKQFTVKQDRCAMKVTTDSCLFGAWVAMRVSRLQNSAMRALDIGTGTGLLALLLAQKTEALVEALEIDAAAASQAKENAEACPWQKRINVVQADVLQWLPSDVYDVILSNPPFYENELKSERTAKNLAHHDAGLTLKELLTVVSKQLKPDGVFFLLMPAKREAGLLHQLKAEGLFVHQIVRVKQTEAHSPLRLMIEGGKMPPAQKPERELAIKTKGNGYSQDFVSLLKDYYLYL